MEKFFHAFSKKNTLFSFGNQIAICSSNWSCVKLSYLQVVYIIALNVFSAYMQQVFYFVFNFVNTYNNLTSLALTAQKSCTEILFKITFCGVRNESNLIEFHLPLNANYFWQSRGGICFAILFLLLRAILSLPIISISLVCTRNIVLWGVSHIAARLNMHQT